MGKRIKHENFRVIIEPRELGDLGSVVLPARMFASTEEAVEKHNRDACDEIVQAVKRHVDGVRRVYVETDERDACEHCGYQWTGSSDDPDYNEGCCHKDEEAHKAKLTV